MKTNSPKIQIIDVTNRDGAQAARLVVSKLSRTMINLYLDKMGIFQSELGFPALGHEKNYINANLELVKRGVIKRLRLQGWCRAKKEDVTLAFENCPDLKHINISVPASDIMIQGKFQGKKCWNDLLKDTLGALNHARALGAQTVGVGASDASRTQIIRLIDFARALSENGADRFRYADTLGLDSPFSIAERIASLAAEVQIPVEFHCHNDLGMASAVSVAGAVTASDYGVTSYINTTINGYGERAGNCDLVSTLLAFRFCPDLNRKHLLDDAVDLTESWKLATYAARAFGLPIPINQPGVGANVFAHASGIHADAMLKDRQNYELYCPDDVGRTDTEIIETGRLITTGPYSGIKGLHHVYERLCIDLGSEARQTLELVQLATLHTQKPLTDDELRFIAMYPDIVWQLVRVG